MQFSKILVASAVLLGQASACLKLHVIMESGTGVFNAQLHDNGRMACLWYSRKFTEAGSRVMSCEPGYHAWMGPDMTQLVLQNEAGKRFLVDIQSVKLAPDGFVWDGEWF